MESDTVISQLIKKAESIDDIRNGSYIKHKLSDIVILTLFVLLANANEWKEIKVIKDWKGLKSIGLEKKTTKRNNGKVIEEERYFICNVDDINIFSRAVRDHWGVENGFNNFKNGSNFLQS